MEKKIGQVMQIRTEIHKTGNPEQTKIIFEEMCESDDELKTGGLHHGPIHKYTHNMNPTMMKDARGPNKFSSTVSSVSSRGPADPRDGATAITTTASCTMTTTISASRSSPRRKRTDDVAVIPADESNTLSTTTGRSVVVV